MQKQIIIPKISRSMIFSFNQIRAMIETQKGLVIKHTIASDIGIIDTPVATRKKLQCPPKLRNIKEYFLSLGNTLSGFYLA